MGETTVLHPPLKENALGLVTGAAMTIGSLYALATDPLGALGWTGLLLFGLPTALLASPAFAPSLWMFEIGPDAIEWRRCGIRRRLAFAEVEAFTTWERQGMLRVGWRLIHGGGAARRMSGVDGTLPSLYGMSPGALVALLEAHRRAEVDDG